MGGLCDSIINEYNVLFFVLGESGCYRNLQRKLFSTVCSDQRRWVFDHIGPTRKCKFFFFMFLNKEGSLCEQFAVMSLSIQPYERQHDVIRVN